MVRVCHHSSRIEGRKTRLLISRTDFIGELHRLWYTPTQHQLADRLANRAVHRGLVDQPVKDDSILVWDYETSAGPQQSPSHLSTSPESDITPWTFFGRRRRRWSTNDMRFPKTPHHWYPMWDILGGDPYIDHEDLYAPSRTRAVLHGASSHSEDL